MARLFSRLVNQGAWTWLDEFNKIDEEVISVIVQQLLTIRFALLCNQTLVEFNYSEIKINHMCGVFVTTNLGYEGRNELPDNVAFLFRPVVMMISKYWLIAEIMLYAEGFKMLNLFQLKWYSYTSLHQNNSVNKGIMILEWELSNQFL